MSISETTKDHLSDSEIPQAEVIVFTPEELEFIGTSDNQSTGSDTPATTSEKKDISISKGAVGAAVVGGVVGAVLGGGVGAVILAGGAVYCTTKSKKMEKQGEKVYTGISKAGKAAKKKMKSVKSRYASFQQRRRLGKDTTASTRNREI